MKPIKLSFCLAIFVFEALVGSAQKTKLLLDKPGIFETPEKTSLPESNCGFSKTEIAANFPKLKGITEAVRQNPVMNLPNGFDCKTDITYWTCNLKEIYGIPAEISFFFRSWSLENGKEVQWINEPPEWAIQINRLNSAKGSGFNVTSNPPENSDPGFNMERWEKAADRVNELFYPPGTKETLGKGIDRYKGEIVVIFNPDRPAYWLQVTIRETFGLLFDYYRSDPNQAMSAMILKVLEEEYSRFSEPERDGYAYYGDSNSISRIGSDSRELPIMRVNTAYWNKVLPRSAIQILSFYCPADKVFIREEKDERLINNDGAYHLSRFIEELTPGTFVPLIDK
ncbi:MAG: hypothetical protein WCI54_04720 [Bacteroidia bacterium]